MRIFSLIPVLAMSLSACEVPPTGPTGPVAMTPFTWKANTPRAVRGNDIFSCELAGRGLPPNATEEMIARAPTGDPVQVAAFVSRCLANKGYTQTERPVCTDNDHRTGQFVQGADILPPLERIKCVDPVRRGLIVA